MKLTFLSILNIIAVLKTGHGIPISSFTNDAGNSIQLPGIKNLSESSNQNHSRLNNITSNELKTDPIITTTNTIKHESPPLTFPTAHTDRNLWSAEFQDSKTNVSSKNSSTTVRTPLTSKNPTNLRTSTEHHTLPTVLPTTPRSKKHRFIWKILAYTLIPVGCLLTILITYCLVRHVQKVRRKRRLERELVHQYSYPNSEADDSEEQNIGDFESVINTHFVAFNDRTDKNLYEDPQTEVNLAFEESSKLLVQESASSIPEELEVSTSFTS